METVTSVMKNIAKFSLAGIAIYFLSFSLLYASAKGCCSKHNGVSNCNASSGYLMCKDGTQSPSCKCSQMGTTNEKSKQSSKATSPKKTTKTTMDTNDKKTSKRGCCKGHGGVASCDKSGYQQCKDGSISSTCKCS